MGELIFLVCGENQVALKLRRKTQPSGLPLSFLGLLFLSFFLKYINAHASRYTLHPPLVIQEASAESLF